MTKWRQIIKLADGKRTDAQIAKIVNCHKNYIRVVTRQRPDGGGQSDIDRRYRTSAKGRATARATKQRYRARLKALNAGAEM